MMASDPTEGAGNFCGAGGEAAAALAVEVLDETRMASESWLISDSDSFCGVDWLWRCRASVASMSAAAAFAASAASTAADAANRAVSAARSSSSACSAESMLVVTRAVPSTSVCDRSQGPSPSRRETACRVLFYCYSIAVRLIIRTITSHP